MIAGRDLKPHMPASRDEAVIQCGIMRFQIGAGLSVCSICLLILLAMVLDRVR